ncbi:iron chelate uptake ABC transporter family permease subunit [Microbacterium sp. VKM Ac-2923]|uniref:FecCD family ABC transporter permease n=1 Tax=Microbacterium sp. VKM Ac-2923 TaxID=2929476 RepID=UPI001FB3D967|nr:iron chelate uptake ABC transporter family permease subunit [Microbacterium sp. VKM Ac-2923]MCJ1708504.1 iron chelate uptake ABC transporter family permease subunit [Microbacterium sp. VKM Ac-2923]
MSQTDAAPARVDFGHRTLVLRRGGAALRWRLRTVLVCAALGLLTLGVAVWSLCVGEYPLSLEQVWTALIDAPDAGFARTVVVEWRAPRIVAAIAFGAALGASGAIFQSLTRNPLASPDIIGFSAGSYTGALVVIILIHGTYLELAGGAVIGGMATAAVVYLLAWRRGMHGFRLIIVGIAVSAMLGSFNTWLLLSADLEVAMSAAAWGAGSLSGTGWTQAFAGTVIIGMLLVVVAALAPGLRQLELGDDAAKATGIRTGPTRLWLIITGVALVAVVTAAAGPITFVALAAPQIARRVARTPGVTVAPAAVMGALMLAGADLIAQHALPVALPVGVVTVVLGGAYLVWLIIGEVRRRHV